MGIAYLFNRGKPADLEHPAVGRLCPQEPAVQTEGHKEVPASVRHHQEAGNPAAKHFWKHERHCSRRSTRPRLPWRATRLFSAVMSLVAEYKSRADDCNS